MSDISMGKSGNQEEIEHRDLSERIIGAAIAVHKALGPGFLETIYEEALCVELAARGLNFERQRSVPLYYRERLIGEHRLDLLVEGALIVELKAITVIADVHFAIVRSYMKAVNLRSGLLLNFATMPLDIKRVGAGHREPFLIS